jgi:DNA recombination protein RmuC
MLERAQKNIHTASNILEEVLGRRTRAIQRKLRNVEVIQDTTNDILLDGEELKDVVEEEDE